MQHSAEIMWPAVGRVSFFTYLQSTTSNAKPFDLLVSEPFIFLVSFWKIANILTLYQ